MTIYIAYKRLRFDIDEVIGVFADKDRAEMAIAEYLVREKEKRQFVDNTEMFFRLASSFEVDVWEVDSITRKDNWGLTEPLLEELMKQIENA